MIDSKNSKNDMNTPSLLPVNGKKTPSENGLFRALESKERTRQFPTRQTDRDATEKIWTKWLFVAGVFTAGAIGTIYLLPVDRADNSLVPDTTEHNHLSADRGIQEIPFEKLKPEGTQVVPEPPHDATNSDAALLVNIPEPLAEMQTVSSTTIGAIDLNSALSGDSPVKAKKKSRRPLSLSKAHQKKSLASLKTKERKRIDKATTSPTMNTDSDVALLAAMVAHDKGTGTLNSKAFTPSKKMGTGATEGVVAAKPAHKE